MNIWTPRNLALVTAGRWLFGPADPHSTLTGLSTDTRTLRSGQVFLALKGDCFDAHDFLKQAAIAGAAVLIVSDEAKARTLQELPVPPAVLLLRDTLDALHDLARAHRDALLDAGVKVITVTGSNGKTTTRHLIHTALSSRFRGTQSPKSFNNQIGLPLTLLGARPTDQFVVAEIGSNNHGEIASLSAIARPDAAVITCIGTAHIGRFGSREAIAAEKSSMLAHLRSGPRSLAVVPANEPLIDPLLPQLMPADVPLCRFGTGPSADMCLTDCRSEPSGIRFNVGDSSTQFSLPLLGRHNALNALSAVAIARWMGLDDATAAAALSRTVPVEMRSNLTHLGHKNRAIHVLNDAYNANPDSMAAALHTLTEMELPAPSSRRVAILGDMLELGDQAEQLHHQLGLTLAECEQSIQLAILIGPLSTTTATTLREHWPAPRVHHFVSNEPALAQHIAALLRPNDLVLLKASRGLALERLLPTIEQRFTTASPGTGQAPTP